MKKLPFLLAATSLIPVALASCSITNNDLPSSISETSDEATVRNVVNRFLAPAEEAVSTGNYKATLTSEELSFAYNLTETTTPIEGEANINTFSASHKLTGGSLSVAAEGLDLENPGQNAKYDVRAHFDEHALNISNDFYLDINASILSYSDFDIALYVANDNVYVDLSDAEVKAALEGLNMDDYVTNPLRIVKEGLYGERTEALVGDNFLGKFVSFIKSANDVLDAIGSIITVEGWDNTYEINCSITKDALIDLYRGVYKIQNRETTLTDEEINALGEEEYSYLTINKCDFSLSFDHFTLTGFSTDIDIDILTEEARTEDDGSTYSLENKLDFIFKSEGSYLYGEEAAGSVSLPANLDSYVA